MPDDYKVVISKETTLLKRINRIALKVGDAIRCEITTDERCWGRDIRWYDINIPTSKELIEAEDEFMRFADLNLGSRVIRRRKAMTSEGRKRINWRLKIEESRD